MTPISRFSSRFVPSAIASVAFGSNQGDSKAIIQGAMADLAQHPDICVESQSKWYRTAPMGPPQPDFMNGCVLVTSALLPEAFLEVLLNLEKKYGRTRTLHWGPRTLDLDLLFYGDRRIQTPRLTLPHPGLHVRPFVLIPLCDICPDWQHPLLHRSIRDLCAALSLEDRAQVIPVC